MENKLPFGALTFTPEDGGDYIIFYTQDLDDSVTIKFVLEAQDDWPTEDD